MINNIACPVISFAKSLLPMINLKCLWKSTDAYMLGAQNPQDNRLWNSGRVALGATVAPGQQYTFSIPVVAPAPGSYGMQWRMLREGAEWFGGTSNSPVTVASAAGGDIVTYIHTDALGSPVARSDAAGNIISRTRYEPYGGTASGVTPTIGFTGHVNDADTGLVYMQQRYYDPVAGRFLSIDPVTTDANTGGSFNRYAYANNNPYKYIDPDGRQVALAGCFGGPVGCVVGVGLTAATAWYGAKAFNDTQRLLQAGSGPKKSDTADLPKSDGKSNGESKAAPELPDKIVGDQSDSRAGVNSSGNKHTSGPLTPGNGGTGDFNKDLQTLTGGTRESKPGDKAPPGSQIGPNGIFGRDPNSTGGKSIDIPANGQKPHETLHY
jgi:RHS repeat-associated protein